MRPCTHCGVAIENNVLVCPSCAQEQRATIGINSDEHVEDAAQFEQERSWRSTVGIRVDEPVTRTANGELERERRQANRETMAAYAILSALAVVMLGFGYFVAGIDGLKFVFCLLVVCWAALHAMTRE